MVAHYAGFVMAVRCFMSAICTVLHIGMEYPTSQGDRECPFCSNFSGMLELNSLSLCGARSLQSGIWHGGANCSVSASVFAAVVTSVSLRLPLSFCVRLSFSLLPL